MISYDLSLMIKTICVLLWCSVAITCYAQEYVSWDELADVTWTEQYDSTITMSISRADFGPLAIKYDQKEVYITGYVIPLDALGLSFALSRNSYAACFFCGQAGPETVMDLYVAPGHIPKNKYNNSPLNFKGTLILKQVNPTGFNYALENATLIH